MNSEDLDRMRLAIEVARNGISHNGNPFGCCISINGTIVSAAYNTTDIDCDPTAHAEIKAIRQACKQAGVARLENATIYTTAEPCPMCMTAIFWAGISKVVYGIGIEHSIRYGFGEICLKAGELSNHFPRMIEVEGCILEDEVKEIFEMWADKNTTLMWYMKSRQKSPKT